MVSHNQKLQKKRTHAHDQSDEESQSSVDTMPIQTFSNLTLNENPNQNQSSIKASFLKAKPISKRSKKHQHDSKDRLRQKVTFMNRKIANLENELEELKKREENCPHCHFYSHELTNAHNNLGIRKTMTPEEEGMYNSYSKRASKDSLEFEKMDFNAPILNNPDMEEKSWVFLGTIMIAMGSKVIDMDGTLNVFKVLKDSVDKIRRQVEKSEQKLSMDFFLAKQELEGDIGMNQIGFDPFYKQNEAYNKEGLQLEGVRVQSVEEYDLFFDQKLSFNVKYESLITIMEYMRQNSSVSY